MGRCESKREIQLSDAGLTIQTSFPGTVVNFRARVIVVVILVIKIPFFSYFY
jgi:hypothetical protein